MGKKPISKKAKQNMLHCYHHLQNFWKKIPSSKSNWSHIAPSTILTTTTILPYYIVSSWIIDLDYVYLVKGWMFFSTWIWALVVCYSNYYDNDDDRFKVQWHKWFKKMFLSFCQVWNAWNNDDDYENYIIIIIEV